jgi:hypothetical protein
MPINNNFYGVYKSLQIGGNKVVVTSATRNRTMEAQAVNYIQGTPKARVMNVGGVEETITLDSPVFVGAGSSVDGRNLANAKINEILTSGTGGSMPILSSAKFSITQQGATVNLTLMSDGNPFNTTVFEIRSDEVPELDPITYGPTRLGRFYDFRVQIGTRTYFIISADISVEVGTEKEYFFMPGNWEDARGYGPAGSGVTFDTTYSSIGNSYYPGTQFPWIGVNSIKISGGGKAAVLLQNLNPGSDNDYLDAGESLNLSLQPGTTDMTLQRPGIAVSENTPFRLELWSPEYKAAGGSGWTSLLPSSIDTRVSLVNTSNFTLGTGLLTVDFNFLCWVR